jgi:broad specificity phosphatase PhoE
LKQQRLIIIRHAETDGNKTRYVGHEDLPLNANGVAQAIELAVALQEENLDAIVSSPLQRAIATAETVAANRQLRIMTEPDLMEIDYGQLQGNIKGEDPFNLRREYFDKPMPGGESLAQVWVRLEKVALRLEGLFQMHGAIAVVGHYWSNRLLVSLLHGKTFQDSLGKGGYRPANASAWCLDWNARANLRCLHEGRLADID